MRCAMKEDFERLILKRLSYYFGRTQTELKQIFSIDSSAKNINEVLLSKMLEIDGKLSSSPELVGLNITPRTIRIQNNGHIKESISFPAFRFTEIVRQKWEDSDFYHILKSTLFMFVIFNENINGNYVFTRVKFWKMPEKDLLEAKKVWENTAKIIREGVKIENDGQVTRNNLPKSSNSPVAHVRPHARDRQDTYPLPDGRRMTKQCFWLNRDYIEGIVTDKTDKEVDTQEVFTTEEESYVSSLLTSDLVFNDDIETKYIEKFGSQHVNRVNAKAVKNLQYRYYSDYVISIKYANDEEYFMKLILDAPVFDISTLDPRLIQSLSFYKVLNLLRSNYDVLEFEEGKFITFKYLNNIIRDISKDTIHDFILKATNFSENKKYMNSHSLRRALFEDKLYECGFSDFFYDRILLYSGMLRFMRIGGELLFYKDVVVKTNGDFIRYLLRDIRSMGIDKMESYLKSEYGILLSKNRIMTIAKTSGLYYDSTMEKIYYAKEDFYNEL